MAASHPSVRTLARLLLISSSFLSLSLLFSSCSSLNLFGNNTPVSVPNSGDLANQNQLAQQLLTQGKQQLANGEQENAEKSFEALIDNYPFSKSTAESRFLLGETLRAQGKNAKAVKAYQNVLELHPNSNRFGNSLNAIYEVAEAARTGAIQTSFLGISRKYDQADIISWYNSAINAAPRSDLAPKILLTLGELYAEDVQRQQATQTLQRLVREYPNSSQAPKAQILLADVISSAGQNTNESSTLEGSREVIEDLQTLYGDDPEIAQQAQERIDEINTTQAANDLKIAQFYEKKGNIRAAALYYREVLRNQDTQEYDIAQSRLASLGVDEGPLGEGADVQLRQLAEQGRILTSERPDFIGPSSPQLVAAGAQGSMRDIDQLFLEDLPDIDTSDFTNEDSGASGIADNPLFQAIEEDDTPSADSPDTSTNEEELSSEELLRRTREKLNKLREANNARNQEEEQSSSNSSSEASSDTNEE